MIAWIKSWFESEERQVPSCPICGEPQIKYEHVAVVDSFRSYCRNEHSW
jgi:hypothetical protein